MGRWLAVTLTVIAVAGGCGGSAGTAAPPRLAHALGIRLAAQAAAVETSLRARNSCAAVTQAGALEASVSQAIAAGQVPAALRLPLSHSVRTLADGIRCVPPTRPPPPPHHKHHGHHGQGNGQGDGGD